MRFLLWEGGMMAYEDYFKLNKDATNKIVFFHSEFHICCLNAWIWSCWWSWMSTFAWASPYVLMSCTNFVRQWWRCSVRNTWDSQMLWAQSGSWLLENSRECPRMMGCIDCMHSEWRIVDFLGEALWRTRWRVHSHTWSCITWSLDLTLFIWHGRFSHWHQHVLTLSTCSWLAKGNTLEVTYEINDHQDNKGYYLDNGNILSMVYIWEDNLQPPG
jgi:hypothetical protein